MLQGRDVPLFKRTRVAAPRARGFTANWHIAARLIEAERPDLIIHLGDVTVDGAGDPAEHGQALEAMQALSAPRLAVPGNHDVGSENPDHIQAVNDLRISRWEAHFGPDRWLRDAGPGRLASRCARKGVQC